MKFNVEFPRQVIDFPIIFSICYFNFLFYFQALDDCLKHHLGDDIMTSINELTSQVKIRGIYKDEVVTLLKQLGY